ncbi:histidine phosphatase family protein [Mycoplasma sp. P36-A1]|uniref:histidine phosphatase family protein n=1 Tax=Mycoplasma sp. P36-A1 TaxID=3252900 RepID=UPI003C2CD3C9
MKLYLVRHGLTDSNVNGKMYYGDEALTQEGIDDLLDKKNVYKNLTFDYAYCSPLLRTKMTFELLFPNKMVDEYREDIIEFDLGDASDFNGSKKELKKYITEQLMTTNDIPELANGELFCDFEKRINNFMNELIKNNIHKDNILVVSHGLAISAMVKHVLETNDIIFSLVPPNGLGYIIDFDEKVCKKIIHNNKIENVVFGDGMTIGKVDDHSKFIDGKFKKI